jgi:hypothetical protein
MYRYSNVGKFLVHGQYSPWNLGKASESGYGVRTRGAGDIADSLFIFRGYVPEIADGTGSQSSTHSGQNRTNDARKRMKRQKK